jgi:CheY-like chemotaxis protein
MIDRRQVLVVARNPMLAECLVAWLEESGYGTTLVRTFADASVLLDARPELVVSEVKLGEYNGLHLALKADAAGVPCIIAGPDDVVLRKDAESIHAIYMTTLTRDTLVDVLTRLLPAAHQAQKVALPFRARVTTVAAEADVMWRAFSESPSPELNAYGRPLLPN